MAKNDATVFFFQEKPVKILLELKRASKPLYVAVIARTTKSAYAHTWRVLLRLEGLGLVEFEGHGRVKLVKLTELGVALASNF